MDSRISTIDKITILYRTGIKFLRGGVRRIFLKESHEIYRLFWKNHYRQECDVWP